MPKYTRISLDRKTHIQIVHILIERRRQSGILEVQSFREADSDTDHYMVVENVMEILAVSKQAAQELNVERCDLRKLTEMEVRKQYQINKYFIIQLRHLIYKLYAC